MSYYFLKLYFQNYNNLLVPFNAFIHFFIFSLFLILNSNGGLRKNFIFLSLTNIVNFIYLN